ncbi:MAG: hypothetical protein ACOX7Q_17070 [Kiritimatiellia bacterium]
MRIRHFDGGHTAGARATDAANRTGGNLDHINRLHRQLVGGGPAQPDTCWTSTGATACRPSTVSEGFNDYPTITHLKDGNQGHGKRLDVQGFRHSGVGDTGPSNSQATDHSITTAEYPAAVTNLSFWYRGNRDRLFVDPECRRAMRPGGRNSITFR